MTSISNLNASNASFVLQYGNYIDFNIWSMIFGTSIVLMLISRYLPGKDDVGRFLISVLAFIFAIAAIWGSLGVAHFEYTNGASLVSNESTINQTITYDYVFPVQQVIASPWLTIVCILIGIFSFLNALDIFIVMMQREEISEQKRGGRGIRI